MRKTKTMICLSTALAVALGMAGLPATALAQEAAGSEGSPVTARAAGSLIGEAAFDDDTRMELEVKRALAQIPAGASDFDKARILHDYLVLNCAYDEENYYAGTIPAVSYSAYGALVNHVAVCNGYTLAYQKLCQAAGLECQVVHGVNHAWNVVMIDGQWYHVDTTWDDPVPNRPNTTRYAYFLLSQGGIEDGGNHSHLRGSDGQLPDASSTVYDNATWKEDDTVVVTGGYSWRLDTLSDLSNNLVKWTLGGGETIVAQGGNTTDDLIWNFTEYKGSIYFLKGDDVFRVNEDDSCELVYTTTYTDRDWIEVIDGQLVATNCWDFGGVEVIPVQPTACSHSYSAQMQPATATEDGRFIDTCSVCGDVQTYVIPATGEAGGTAPSEPSVPVTPPTPPVTGEDTGNGGNGTAEGEVDEGQSGENGTTGENASEESTDSEGTGGEAAGEEQATEDENSQEQEEQPEQQLVKPAKVKGVKAIAKKGAATVSWSKVKGASGYQVYYKTGSGAWKHAAASAKASSKKIAKLKRGKTYQFKVRAIAKSAGKTLSGSWSKTVKIRVK